MLVALPPQAQSAVVRAALAAGKHVLSEKPAAPSLGEALQLLAFHRGLQGTAPLWCVAENYRCMGAMLRLRDAVAGGQLGGIARLSMDVDLGGWMAVPLGSPSHCLHLLLSDQASSLVPTSCTSPLLGLAAMAPGNRYYESQWRRDSAGMPGAYLTEGGVHFVAALRMAARAAGWGEAVAVAATGRSVNVDLPSPDTLQGVIWFQSGDRSTLLRHPINCIYRAAPCVPVAPPPTPHPYPFQAPLPATPSPWPPRPCTSACGQWATPAPRRRSGAAWAPWAAAAPFDSPSRLWATPGSRRCELMPCLCIVVEHGCHRDATNPIHLHALQEEVEESGVAAELLCFSRLVHAARASQAAAAVAAAAAPGTSERGGGDAEAAAPVVAEGGEVHVEDFPSSEDSYRIRQGGGDLQSVVPVLSAHRCIHPCIPSMWLLHMMCSCEEAVLDLAVVTALLQSAASGGERTAVTQL